MTIELTTRLGPTVLRAVSSDPNDPAWTDFPTRVVGSPYVESWAQPSCSTALPHPEVVAERERIAVAADEWAARDDFEAAVGAETLRTFARAIREGRV